MVVMRSGVGAPLLALGALLLALPLAPAVEEGKPAVRLSLASGPLSRFTQALFSPNSFPYSVKETFVQATFFQESFPSRKESGDIQLNMNEEEAFHVDWEERKDVWRLPDFKSFTYTDPQEGLVQLTTMKYNLEIMIQRSNQTQARNVAPSARVYPEDSVELGDPNVLICFVDQFSPPVLNITWLKNGEVVLKGVQETTFYPSMDNTFRKFSYLPFIPEEGDVYACQVDHWGLPESLTRIWYPKTPTTTPKTADNVVCVLGLAFAVLGIVVGPVLFFKARKMTEANHRRGGI